MTFYPAVDDGIDTIAPYRRRVGHEVELAGQAEPFRDKLYEAGLAPRPPEPYDSYYRGLHPAGCHCTESNDYPLHAMFDSSSTGGEYTIGGNGGVLYGSDRYLEAVDTVCRLVAETPEVNINYQVGSHIHVDNTGATELGVHNLVHLNYSRVEDDILLLARCEFPRFRANGHVPTRLSDQPTDLTSARWNGGSTITSGRRGTRTFEFRVWNATVNPLTLSTNAAVCVALVERSVAGDEADGRSLLDFVGDHVPPHCAEDIERRLASAS